MWKIYNVLTVYLVPQLPPILTDIKKVVFLKVIQLLSKVFCSMTKV